MKSTVIVVVVLAVLAGFLVYSGQTKREDSVLNTEPKATTTPLKDTQVATSTKATTSTTIGTKPTSPAPAPKPAPTPSTSPAPAPAPTPTVKTYTTAEVSTHSSKESCYTVVRGKVYDITSYIPRHPGGEREIMKICGKDGTSLFEGQHGGQSGPESKLQSFFIGNLAI